MGFFGQRSNKKIYDSKRWKHLRMLKINRNPVCEICKRQPAHTVDHKIPINQGGPIWDIEGLTSLCKTCNFSKTGRDGHKYKLKKVTYEQIFYARDSSAWVKFCALYEVEKTCIKQGTPLTTVVTIKNTEFKAWGLMKNHV